MKRLALVLTGCLSLAGAVASASSGNDPEAAFEQANRLYEEGQYLGAIEAYQPLLTNQPTPALRFNLGNAFFKSGQMGEAITEYRQAARLAPRDPDVRANLRFARARVDGPSYQPGWLTQRAQSLTTGEWTTVTIGAFWTLFALLTARALRPGWRQPLRSWTVLAGVLTILTLSCAVWVARTRSSTRIAVVTQRDAVMRRGPFEESQRALDLKNGAELLVLDQKENWMQVTPDNRELGWVPAGHVRIIDP